MDDRGCLSVRKSRAKRGYIALASVLVISAVVLVAAVSTGLLSLSESQMGYAVRKGDETLFFVEGCLEEALLRVRRSSDYAGGPLNLPEGQCTIDVTKVDSDWIIVATGSEGGHSRQIEAKVRRTCNQIELYYWLEVE